MIDESDSNKNKINICTMVVTTNKKETTTTTSSTITIVSPPNTCRFNKVVVPDTDVCNIKAYKRNKFQGFYCVYKGVCSIKVKVFVM